MQTGTTISAIARQVGLRPSAIRYYEQIGLLPAPARVSGRRQYDYAVLKRLAVVQRARECGFTLEEIRRLFFGFGPRTAISARWRALCSRKYADLDQTVKRIRGMQELLSRMQARCRCQSVEQCGSGILRSGLRAVKDSPLGLKRKSLRPGERPSPA